jgi:hypothetical protein
MTSVYNCSICCTKKNISTISEAIKGHKRKIVVMEINWDIFHIKHIYKFDLNLSRNQDFGALTRFDIHADCSQFTKPYSAVESNFVPTLLEKLDNGRMNGKGDSCTNAFMSDIWKKILSYWK